MCKAKFCAITILFLVGSNQALADRWKNSVGAGIQYGGAIGWQGSYIQPEQRFRISLGYTGATLGYDRYFGLATSIGLQGFFNQYKTGFSLNANYHFSGNENAGWIIGLDVYRGYDSGQAALDLFTEFFEYVFDSDESLIDAKIHTGAAISLGYQF